MCAIVYIYIQNQSSLTFKVHDIYKSYVFSSLVVLAESSRADEQHRHSETAKQTTRLKYLSLQFSVLAECRVCSLQSDARFVSHDSHMISA